MKMDDDDEKGVQLDDGDKVVMEEFLADVLVDDNSSGSGADCRRSEVASPESGGAAEGKVVEDVVVIDGEGREEVEDGQVSKKRRY